MRDVKYKKTPKKRVRKNLGFVYCDGGRFELGFRERANDCVVRAIAIASGMSYLKVHYDLNRLSGESPEDGVYRRYFDRYLKKLGFEWVSKVRSKTTLKVENIPSGRVIVRLSEHLAAIIDHKIYDTYDPAERGMRRVYGYYVKKVG